MPLIQKTDKLFGAAERAIKRKKRQESVENHTYKLISIYIPELTKAEVKISTEIYKTKLAQLLSRIETDSLSIKEFRVSRNYLARFINEGNKTGKWRLDIPPFLHRVQREAPLRNAKWFKTSKVLNLWLKDWLEHLEQIPAVSEELSREEVLACTLISAALFGGLCLPYALEALKHRLLNEVKPLYQAGDQIWLDLTFDSKEQAHNILNDGNPLTLRRWYPDNFTLAWINNYLEGKSNTKETASTTWALIKAYLNNITKGTGKAVGSLNKFCSSASGVTENLNGVRLSQAMIEYLVGRVSSASLPNPYHDAVMCQPTYSPIQNINEKSSFKALIGSAGVTRNHFKFTANYEAIIAEIRAGLSPTKMGDKKNTPQAAQTELEKVGRDQFPKALSALIEWLISLLAESKKVSSVMRYFSAIGKPWLASTAELDIDELDAEEFESLYRDILDTQLSEKNRHYMAGRFNQFHIYLSRHQDLPVLPIALDDLHSSNRPFVRAAFITEQAFSAFIHSLDILAIPQREKQTLKCMFVIAYRTGLRRGELLKLRLQDIEPSQQRWLFIRNNRYGNNKSSSARRKIPLTVLLTESERKLFEDYLAQKMLHDDSTQALLFSLDQAPHIPMDGNYVSTLAKTLLTDIMGFPVIFYHFRHSALSRLQVILEDEQELIYKIGCYSDKQVQQIKKALGGFDDPNVKRDIYWALAGFAGHLTPETTFSNYLHFTDNIVANKLKRATLTFSANTIKQVSGLSSNIITRQFGKYAIQAQQIDLAPFSGLLRRRLEKHSEIIEVAMGRQANNLGDTENERVHLHKPSKPTVETCLAVLKSAEQKATMQELVLKFNLEEDMISSWLEKAKEIAGYTTSKNKSRVFSRFKTETHLGEPLTPSRPQSNAELRDAIKAIKKLREIYSANKAAINWCIEHFINNTNTSNAGIIFSSPKELQKYLNLMVKVFPKSRWRLSFTPLIGLSEIEQLRAWQQHSENIPITLSTAFVRRKSKYPKGKLIALLAHPDEKELIKDSSKSHYSTNVITYIFHVLAIMIHRL